MTRFHTPRRLATALTLASPLLLIACSQPKSDAPTTPSRP